MNKIFKIKSTLNLSLIAGLVMATGCAHKAPPAPAPVVDPFAPSAYMVAANIDEVLDRSAKKIDANTQLLRDIRAKKTTTVTPVTHMHSGDARSDQDIAKIKGPQYPQQSNSSQGAQNLPTLGGLGGVSLNAQMLNGQTSLTGDVVRISGKVIPVHKKADSDLDSKEFKGTDALKVSRLEAKIADLAWQHSSLNELLLKIADNAGYELKIVQLGQYNDLNINLRVSNVSSLSVLESIAAQVSKSVQIKLSHSRQKIVVTYL